MMTMTRSRIVGLGRYAPARRVENAEIEARLGLAAGWIERRTGIRARRYAADDEAVTDLAAHAGDAALTASGLPRADIALTLLATSTPDHLLPPSAPLLVHRLGLPHSGAIDLAGACAGFVYTLTLADSFVRTHGRPVLVVAANVLSRRINPADRDTSVLFADAAGAVVLAPSREATSRESAAASLAPQASSASGSAVSGPAASGPAASGRAASAPGLVEVGMAAPGVAAPAVAASAPRAGGATALGDPSETGLLGVDLVSDGALYDLMRVPAGGSRTPFTRDRPETDLFMEMRSGRLVFTRAVELMTASSRRALTAAGLSPADISRWIPHQANIRIVDAVRRNLGLPEARVVSTIAEYGNSSAATIPFSMAASAEVTPFAPGERVLLTAVGAGLTAGAVVYGF